MKECLRCGKEVRVIFTNNICKACFISTKEDAIERIRQEIDRLEERNERIKGIRNVIDEDRGLREEQKSNDSKVNLLKATLLTLEGKPDVNSSSKSKDVS